MSENKEEILPGDAWDLEDRYTAFLGSAPRRRKTVASKAVAPKVVPPQVPAEISEDAAVPKKDFVISRVALEGWFVKCFGRIVARRLMRGVENLFRWLASPEHPKHSSAHVSLTLGLHEPVDRLEAVNRIGSAELPAPLDRQSGQIRDSAAAALRDEEGELAARPLRFDSSRCRNHTEQPSEHQKQFQLNPDDAEAWEDVLKHFPSSR